MHALVQYNTIQYKPCVALTGRNTTGPLSRGAPWWVMYSLLRCITDDDGRQTTPDAREHH